MKVRIVRPALYVLEGTLDWSWVRLRELANALELSPSEVWLRFFFANTHPHVMVIAAESDAGFNLHAVYINGLVEDGIAPARVVLGQEDGSDAFAFGSSKNFLRELVLGNFFVPAGWAECVYKHTALKELRVNPRESYQLLQRGILASELEALIS